MATTVVDDAVELVEQWRALDEKSHSRMTAVGRVAARLFGEKGYLNVTMDGIATESGVSKGGIYHYFQSKEEILFFIINSAIDDLLRGLPDELQVLNPEASRIAHLMKRQLDYYYGHLPEVKTLLNDRKLLGGSMRRLVELKEERYFRIAEDVVRSIAPSVSVDRTKAITFAFFGLCNWIPSWYQPDGPLGIDDILDVNLRLFLAGIEALEKHASGIPASPAAQ